jgi:anti-sigma B factor antagonist
MEFSITEYKHCDLITITGRVDSYTSPIIDKAIKALFTDGRFHMVIDMKDVAYISSSGMLVFVNAQKFCHRQDRGEIVFANVSDNILSNFKLAGFDKFFKFYNNTASAVGRF